MADIGLCLVFEIVPLLLGGLFRSKTESARDRARATDAPTALRRNMRRETFDLKVAS